MRQFRIVVTLALVLFFSTTPAYATSKFPLFSGDPLVPAVCDGGPLGVGGILTFIQNVMNAGISVGIIIFIFIIVYAGFMFILTPTNPEGHSQAKKMLSNAVIGFIIILAAWLIVDFVMKILYNDGENGFGPWNEILSSTGSQCIERQDPTAIGGLGPIAGATVNNGIQGIPGGAGGSSNVGVAKGLCSDRNTSCSPAVMKTFGLSDAQANAMSCIAVTESAGGANKGNSGTGAQGLFQITGTNWNISKYHTGRCSSQTSRLDDYCNAQTAVLMQKYNGYQPWTGKCMSSGGCGNVSYGQYWNPNAVACVNKYDPGH